MTARGARAVLALAALAGACGDDPARPAAPDAGALPPLGAEPRGLPTRHPIVLVPGLDPTGAGRWRFLGVVEALRRDGQRAAAVALPYGPPEERVAVLAGHLDRVLRETRAPKVNVVAHSLAGLDARAVIATGYGDRVASLTTVATPHYGTRLADAALGLPPAAPDAAAAAVGLALGVPAGAAIGDPGVRAVLRAMSEARAGAFNAVHPDDPRVFYQSWAGLSAPSGRWDARARTLCGRLPGYALRADALDPLLEPAAAIVGGAEGAPNDGVVRVTSARWGQFRGCIPADHLDALGQVDDRGADPVTGFDHLRFYRNLADGLAARGY